MVIGIHHFAIIASSEASIEFYTKLGFQEFKRIKRENDMVVQMAGNGLVLEMFVDSRHEPRSNPEPFGLLHIALHVDSIEDTVKELGLELGAVMKDWVGKRACFIVDPDGNAIELHE